MAYDGEIKINTTIDTKNVSAQMLSIDNQIAKTADKIDLLKQKMSAMKDSAAPTSEYKSLQSQIEKAKLSPRFAFSPSPKGKEIWVRG